MAHNSDTTNLLSSVTAQRDQRSRLQKPTTYLSRSRPDRYFPYRIRDFRNPSRRATAVLTCVDEDKVVNYDHAVDFNLEDQPLDDILVDVTASHSLQIASELAVQVFQNADAVGEDGVEDIEDEIQPSTNIGIPALIIAPKPEGSQYTSEGWERLEDLEENMGLASFLKYCRANEVWNEDSPSTPNRPICPCSHCAFSSSTRTQPSLSSYPPNNSPPPPPNPCKELIKPVVQKTLNPKTWFRRHSRQWSTHSDTTPLFPSGISAESMNLEIEHDQLFTELQHVQDLQQYNLKFGPRKEIYAEDRRRDVVREHGLLKNQERVIMERIEGVEREIERLCYWERTDIYNRFGEGVEQFSDEKETSLLESWNFFGGERASVEEAKKELEIYNQRWASIINSPPGSTNLEIPLPAFSNHQYATQKQQAILFFTRAFGLTPSLTYNLNNIGLSDNKYSLLSETDTSRIEALSGLREQLKIEKVRWHEDRIRLVFGVGATKDERVKVVWGAVVELKNMAEKEIGGLGEKAE